MQCKGSHLTVFAPYHFQRISALETIGALSCLSSPSTFNPKHLSTGAEETKGNWPQEMLFADPDFFIPASFHYSFLPCQFGDIIGPLPVWVAPKVIYNSGRELLKSLWERLKSLRKITVLWWISCFLQAAFFLSWLEIRDIAIWWQSTVPLVYILSGIGDWMVGHSINKYAKGIVEVAL